jgi:hypothetical protein
MSTLDQTQIVNIATGVATANLGQSNFTSVSSTSTIDSTGRDALQITIVLSPGFAPRVTGEIAANTVFDMNRRLRDAGEERFSIVRYST